MNALRKLIHHVFGFTPESRSKANADKAANLPVCDADADLISRQYAANSTDADSCASAADAHPDERRARNLAKLEARKAEAAAKHRATMATKPGARS